MPEINSADYAQRWRGKLKKCFEKWSELFSVVSL
jgi:hypothetical protein